VGVFSIPPIVRVDLDYFAPRWRQAGKSLPCTSLAWALLGTDPQADEYLRRLIEPCHRTPSSLRWIELPHVS